MDLSEFLLARIAEDEASAQGTYCGGWLPPEERGENYRPHYPDKDWAYCDGCCAAEAADWANPRTLAECEAKRRIVEEFAALKPVRVDLAEGIRGAMEHVVKVLALPCADHPDYQESWRP